MAGLDRVRGPHWSQILAMFGPGGTINESLKDRNQVQLKDKARNLKLFFLKSGIEVPYYLKYVTGDLKSRAPGQASKNEARERERRQGEEDKAHFNGVQGIMALSGASQQSLQSPLALDEARSPNVDVDGGTAAGPRDEQVHGEVEAGVKGEAEGLGDDDGDHDDDEPAAVGTLPDFSLDLVAAAGHGEGDGSGNGSGNGRGVPGPIDMSMEIDATLDPTLQDMAVMAKTELTTQ